MKFAPPARRDGKLVIPPSCALGLPSAATLARWRKDAEADGALTRAHVMVELLALAIERPRGPARRRYLELLVTEIAEELNSEPKA